MGMPSFEFFSSPSGQLTCRYQLADREILLHSKYQPEPEAARFAETQLELMSGETCRIIIYGIGCGHHVRATLERTESHIMVDVLELNVPFAEAVCARPEMQTLLSDPRVRLFATDDVHAIRSFVHGLREEPVHLVIHEPSLQLIPPALEKVQDALINFHVQQKSLLANRDKLGENFKMNMALNLPGIDMLLDQFAGVPTVLVASGPSLEQQLDALRELRNHCLIATVGRSLGYLMKHGIEPDMFMISDANEVMMEQIQNLPHHEVPLFCLSTVYHGIPEHYPGPRFITLQRGMNYSNYPTPDERVLIGTGGSVATSMFAVLCKMGVSAISVVGLDLAFTHGRTHARGALTHREMNEAQLVSMPEVPNFDGTGTVKTSRSLMSFRQWFMMMARHLQADSPSMKLYNSSRGGAYIDGFEHVDLSVVLDQFRHIDISEARERFRRLTKTAWDRQDDQSFQRRSL
jgi:hypothetical protein